MFLAHNPVEENIDLQINKSPNIPQVLSAVLLFYLPSIWTIEISHPFRSRATSAITINHTHRHRIVAETSANRTNFPLQSAKTNYRRRFRRKPYHENGKSMSLYYLGARK